MTAPPDSGSQKRPSGMDPLHTRHVLEACLLVAGRAMSVVQLQALFRDDTERDDTEPNDTEPNGDQADRDRIDPSAERATRTDILDALTALQADYEGRGIELVEVASGWRLQSRKSMEPWVCRLLQERPPRYSRALLETLVLVAYRQPITRGEIEQVRGVAVSSSIIKTLQEREWVREIGHKDVPGKPALLGTTRQFLDYFNLKRLEDLPPLGELKDLDSLEPQLDSVTGDVGEAAGGVAANDGGKADDGGEGRDGDGGAENGDGGGQSDEGGEGGEGGLADSGSAPGEVHASVGEPVARPVDAPAESVGDVEVSREARRDVDHGLAREEPRTHEEPQAYEDPQARLRQVIDRFAAEHRQDLADQGRPVVARANQDAGQDAAPAGASAAPVSHRFEAEAPERDDDVP